MQKKLTLLTLVVTLMLSSSCLKQGAAPKIPGIDGPKLNIANGKILLSVGLENVDLQGGLTLPLPKMKNSTVTVGPTLEGSLIQVAFDLKDVDSEEFRVVPSNLLPDGRPFPFLAGGELPAIAINVPKVFDTTFYASEKVFGFFLPIKLPEGFNTSINYRLKINGKAVGLVSLINPQGQDQGGGVVLLLTLDDIRQNDDFDTLINLSKRTKRVF